MGVAELHKHTMVVAVKRSAPVSTTITRPRGKTPAPINLMRPGAFSWYQGAVMAVRETAQPNERRQPAETAERKTLSGRIFPLLTPVLEMSSIVSAGVYAAKLLMFTTSGLLMVKVNVEVSR